MKLENPHRGTTGDDTRLNINIGEEAYNFLFRGVFAGDRGVKAALINTLLDNFVQHLKNNGVEGHWSPENQQKTIELLQTYGQQPTEPRPATDKPAVGVKKSRATKSNPRTTDDASKTASGVSDKPKCSNRTAKK